MSRIRILPDALASQVAAGEVVERPAAVVRELVENSLDSGASLVEVHVQQGGAALLKVVDNGCGMDREDALLCLERHATSKIRTKQDLAAICTLGFRGEALPSIASVSRFRLSSREADALAGTEVEVNGGRLSHVRDYGGAPGTRVEVAALFYNVPARRKFLRSEQTEFAHVEQQFRLHAIANPSVAFTLVKDGAVLFHLPATLDLLERIEGFIGREMAQRLVPLPDHEYEGVRVRGYVGGPGISRSNRQQTLTFLNRRPVESPAIHYGLREGYHTMLMKGQNPVTFLFIEMNPEGFDINVHPAKKEVRFRDARVLREAVVRCISQALERSSGISTGHAAPHEKGNEGPKTEPTTEQQRPLIPEHEQTALRADWASLPSWSTADRGSPGVAATPFAAQSAPPVQPIMAGSPVSQRSTEPASSVGVPPPDPLKREGPGAAPKFRILGVLNRLYVLMEGDDGLVLMDQHAAHERVLFEQMRSAMEQAGVPAQRLLLPLTLQVSPRDYDMIQRNLGALARLGIEAEPFGNNALKVDALPAFMRTDDPLALLRNVIDELASTSSRTSTLRLGEDMIATTVCRHAVKANDHLREPELQKLLDDLFRCQMPYCCPHGRPTLIQISFGELERKFGRRAP